MDRDLWRMLLPWRSRYLGGLDDGRGRGDAAILAWGVGKNRARPRYTGHLLKTPMSSTFFAIYIQK